MRSGEHAAPPQPPARDQAPPSLGLAWFLGFVGVVAFGGTLPFTKLAVAAFEPAFVTAARAAAAGLLAGAWLLARGGLRARGRRQARGASHLPADAYPGAASKEAAGVAPDATASRPTARDLGALAFVAATLVLAFPFFMAVGMRHVPAAHGAVVLGVLPLATALAAAALGHERPSRAFLVVAGVGAALVVAFALRQGSEAPAAGAASSFGAGDLALAAGVAATAFGYAVSARLAARLGGPAVISWALVLALPVTAPASLALWGFGLALAPGADAGNVPPSALVGLAYVTLFSQWLGFFAWNRALALGGAGRIGQVQLLQTFVTLAWAALLLGEAVTAETLLFALAVLATVLLGRRLPLERR